MITNATIYSTLLFTVFIYIIEIVRFSSALETEENSIDGLLDRNKLVKCDPELCDPIVNKCRMTERCSCDFKKEAYCIKDCIDCLEEKFGKCCPCIDGLCPHKFDGTHPSHVGHTTFPDQSYFEVLTETDDIHGRWSVFTLTDGMKLDHPELGQIELAYRDSIDKLYQLSHDSRLDKMNCTVAFWNRYLSMSKCKKSCTSLGASQYRWFHNGCCECIGKYCVNYGMDEPRCILRDD